MKYALLLLLAFVTGCSGCTSIPPGKGYALRLQFQTGLCSGTATGSSELLTAAHCMSGSMGDLVSVNGTPVKQHSYTIGEREGRDAIRVHFDAPRFSTWARRYGKAKQGDRVHWNGNPLGTKDMQREGYVSGITDTGVVIAAPVCVGDSGRGVFNDRGELVGVVSAMPTEKCASFALAVELS